MAKCIFQPSAADPMRIRDGDGDAYFAT